MPSPAASLLDASASPAQTGHGMNTSSDFVRKLYSMVEDSEHSDIVRWGKDGDSFVVIECEKFANAILPKHFKHNNFSSFVRQLNKYDFHKTKKTEASQTPEGYTVWEFKHPDFMANNQANFDNIRRKAPTSRKSQIQVLEESVNSQQQHITMLNENIRSMTQQIDQLQASCSDLTQKNKLLVNEIVVMQRMMEAQKRVQSDMLGYLEQKDSASCHPSRKNESFEGADSHLRRARELLSSTAAADATERELETSPAIYTPPTDSQSSIYPGQLGTEMGVLSESSDMPTLYGVYPAGRNVGIDPFHADHIDKIPYIRAPDVGTPPDVVTSQPANLGPSTTSDWGPRKPFILLVEDDRVCRRIGTKFLQNLGCNVRTAVDGVDAIAEVNRHPEQKFDLVFMDIIMPRLDGVSTATCIRESLGDAPVIAMTSNIRHEDVSSYYQHGLRDVLAKPFTKDGMLRMLKKHLSNFPGTLGQVDLNDASYASHSGQAASVQLSAPLSVSTPLTSAPLIAGMNTTTSTHSPSTVTSWQSPGQLAQQSPRVPAAENNYIVHAGASLLMTPATSQSSLYPTNMINAPVTGGVDLSMVSDRPEKRQRLYGPEGSFVSMETGLVQHQAV